MNCDVYFESQKRLEEFLDLVEPFASGSEVIGYLYYGRILKLFEPALTGEKSYSKEEVFAFSKIETPSFIFPQNGVYYNNQLIGYLTQFINGLAVQFSNMKYISIDTLLRAFTIYCEDLVILSKHFILAKDTYYTNLILRNDRLYNIDTLEFEQVDKPVEDILKINMDDLARALYPCLVNKTLKEFIKKDIELRQFYYKGQFQYSIVQFLQRLQQKLSEYGNAQIQNLEEGSKVLKR